MLNQKKMTQHQKRKNSKTQSRIVFPVQQLSNGESPYKVKVQQNAMKHPRTCEESPETRKPFKRLDTNPQQYPIIKLKGIVMISKNRNRVKKVEMQSDPKDFADVFISPIQKIPSEFVNIEDSSLINALKL